MTTLLDRPCVQPFPITNGRYEVAAGMRPFGRAGFGMPAESGHFRLDSALPELLAAKLDVLADHGDAARQIDAAVEPEGAAEALWRTLSLAAAEEPDWVRVDGDEVVAPMLGLGARRRGASISLARTAPGALAGLGDRVASVVEAGEGLDRLLDFVALIVPCDLAMMRMDDAGGRAELLHVCFPSSWAPRLKVGQSFAAIHGPVANNERIMKASDQLLRAMCFRGPFVRYAWGLHRHGALASHPEHRPARVDVGAWTAQEVAAQTWLRVERQTTAPMGDLGRGLFTIRTFVEPLVEVAQDAAKAAQIAAAIRSMDAASRRYKGMEDRAEALLRYLDRAAIAP